MERICRKGRLRFHRIMVMSLSYRRPPEMCGLRTRPRTDVDPPRFLDRTAIGGRAYRLAALGAITCFRFISMSQYGLRCQRSFQFLCYVWRFLKANKDGQWNLPIANVRTHISETTHPSFTKLADSLVTNGCGSVLLWRRCTYFSFYGWCHLHILARNSRRAKAYTTLCPRKRPLE